MPWPARKVAPTPQQCQAASAIDPTLASQPGGPSQDPPPPPPPRPPRPMRVPGYICTAPTSADAARWLQQQVFYTQDKAVALGIRGQAPVFLWDAEAQQLHGVYQRTQDAQTLVEDLTTAPGPQGYQVHVLDLYNFSVPLAVDEIDDLLVWQTQQQQQPAAAPASNTSSSFECILGSWQHGALWEAFMKKSKRQRKALEAVQEEEQQLETPRRG